MSGVSAPPGLARVDKSTSPRVHGGKPESLLEHRAERKREAWYPCPDAAPASTWGLPTRHRREAVLGPGKTHGPRV